MSGWTEYSQYFRLAAAVGSASNGRKTQRYEIVGYSN